MTMFSSLQNERVKEWIKLQKNSRFRFDQKRYIAEGPKMLMEISPELIEQVVVAEGYSGPMLSEWREDSITTVSDKVFKAVSMETTPQGIFAVVRMRDAVLDELTAAEVPLLVMLENVQDPGNAGTILRTAEAAGTTGVVLTKGSVDIYNPKVVQSAMGAITRLPVVAKADVEEAIIKMRDAGISVFVGDLKAEQWHFEADYTGGTCFLMGNEGSGISDKAARLANKRIRIPMPGNAESLNVGIATGVLLFEAVRQRMIK